MSGLKAPTARLSRNHARGSKLHPHGVSVTAAPCAAARRANSLPRFVTRTCSTPGSRTSSRHSSRTWFWPPRHSRPESTCRTRTASGRRLHVGEYAPQLVQLERLVEEGAAQPLEELEGVAAHSVAGGEDDPLGHGGVHLRQRLVHLASPEARHPQVADDEIER